MSNIITDIQVSGVTYTLSGSSSGGNATVELTQAEYDALVSAGTVSADTFYIITDAEPVSSITSGAVQSMIDSSISGKADSSDVQTLSGTVTGMNNTLTAHTANTNIHVSSSDKNNWNAKQDALTAGNGIDITSNVISVTGGGITSGEVQTMIEDKITSSVTSGSTDAISSGGIYEQLGGLGFMKVSEQEWSSISGSASPNIIYYVYDSSGNITVKSGVGVQPQYRTISGTPYCTGADLYVVTSAQTSYDGGMTWTTTSTAETLVESASSQCQVSLAFATYNSGGSLLTSGDCNSLSSGAITRSVITNNGSVNINTIYAVEIGTCATSIAAETFKSDGGDVVVTSVTFDSGSTLTTIGARAFKDAKGIRSISLPNSLTTIGEYAFSYTDNIEGVFTIPSGVTAIGTYAFEGLTKVTRFVVEATTPPSITGQPFVGTSCPIYVPCNSVNAYKSAWSSYSGRITCDSPTPTLTWVTADENFDTSTPIYEIGTNDETRTSSVNLTTSGGTDYNFDVSYDTEEMTSSYRLMDSNGDEIDSGSGMYCNLYSVIGEPVYLTSIPSYEECSSYEMTYCQDENCEGCGSDDQGYGECGEECTSYDYYYSTIVKVPQ